MTPKQADFLTRVQNGERVTWAELGRLRVSKFLDPFWLSPDEAEAQGVADPEECAAARLHCCVFTEIGCDKPRFRLTSEGEKALAEHRS